MSTEPKHDTTADIETFDWMLSVDDRLLGYLAERGATRPAGIAGPLGLHLAFARTRCERLAEHALVEDVDGHYRLTERGRQYLDRTTSD